MAEVPTLSTLYRLVPQWALRARRAVTSAALFFICRFPLPQTDQEQRIL